MTVVELIAHTHTCTPPHTHTPGRKKVKPTLKPPSSVSERTTSPTFRHKQPIKPPPPKTNPSPKMAPGGARASSHTKITAPVKISHSVRERVIHFLALKPQRREEVLSKIRKGKLWLVKNANFPPPSELTILTVPLMAPTYSVVVWLKISIQIVSVSPHKRLLSVGWGQPLLAEP